MNLAPTWDLFIIVIFILVITYSFIVRASGTGKMILATYAAILTADALGNLLYQNFAGPSPTIRILNIASSTDAIIKFKVVLFVLVIIFLALKGAYDSHLADETGGMMGVLITAVLGFLNAGLIVSAALVYMTGGSFVAGLGASSGDLALSIYESSQAARIMIDYADFWFSFPAIAFIVSSMITSE